MISQSLNTLTLLVLFFFSSLSLNCAASSVTPELKVALLNAVANADSFDDQFDAQVWLLAKSTVLSRYVKDDQQRITLLTQIHREASRANVDPSLVLSVIQIESLFDRFAVSRVGAQGMMQIMPFWKNEIGRSDDNLMDIQTNLRYGCTILKHYLDREKGNWRLALARYNGSVGSNRYPEKVLGAWTKRWR